MRVPIWTVIAMLCVGSAVEAQNIGKVVPVEVVDGMATIPLDFSNSDYELILYPTVMDEPNVSRSFSYTVSGAHSVGAPKLIASSQWALSADEDPVAQCPLHEDGVERPPPRKPVALLQSTRTFEITLDDIGHQVIEAELVAPASVASSTRVLGYRDNALVDVPDRVSDAEMADISNSSAQFKYTL